jgi:hypothetical protein
MASPKVLIRESFIGLPLLIFHGNCRQFWVHALGLTLRLRGRVIQS